MKDEVRMRAMIKLKQLAGIFLGIPLAFLISGCLTPPPPQRIYVEREPERVYVERAVQVEVEVVDTRMPLTLATIQRLVRAHGDMADDLSHFQLHLFGRVILEREYTIPNHTRVDGGARFENVHVREVITINDQTEGQAIRADYVNGEVLLSVSFDDGDDVLIFSSRADNLNGFFSLQYDSGGMTPAVGDERGTLMFGGHQFRLRYTGYNTPYLLIRLTQSDVDRLHTRVLGGRRVH